MDFFSKTVAKLRLFKLRRNIPSCFWLFDRFLLVASFHVLPQKNWQKKVWILYQAVGAFQLLMTFLGLTSALGEMNDVLLVIWCMILFSAEIVCLAKCFLLMRYDAEVQDLRNFLSAGKFTSGDLHFDNSARQKYQRSSSLITIAVSSIILLDQLVCWTPKIQQAKTFYVPPWICTHYGEWFAFVVQAIHTSTFASFWLFKIFGCSVLSIFSLKGLKAEQTVVNRSFERLTELLKDLQTSKLTRQEFWDHLKSSIKVTMDQQTLIFCHLIKVQPMVELLYYVTYFYAIGCIGSSFFLVLSQPMSILLFLHGATVTVICFECYQLGYQIDCLKDVFEATSGCAFSLCAQLPYSAGRHRQDYLEVRNTLKIIALCSRNLVRFRCLDIPDISVTVFVSMVKVSYSVLTFLLNMV